MSTPKSNESLISKSATSGHKSELSLENGWQAGQRPRKSNNEPSILKSSRGRRIHSPASKARMAGHPGRQANRDFGASFRGRRTGYSGSGEVELKSIAILILVIVSLACSIGSIVRVRNVEKQLQDLALQVNN